MANYIDVVSIEGMEQSDFIQLREIFDHVMEEDIRWDRLDYWDKRNARLKGWLDEINEMLVHNKIKKPK
jgi:hypothetical protein